MVPVPGMIEHDMHCSFAAAVVVEGEDDVGPGFKVISTDVAVARVTFGKHFDESVGHSLGSGLMVVKRVAS